MTELEALIILTQIPDLGPIRIKKLVEYFGTATNVLNATIEEITIVDGIGENIAKKIFIYKTKIDPVKEIELATRNGIKIVKYQDKEYPFMLKFLPDAPRLLYMKGEFRKNDNLSISIVGTRKPTSYGRLVVEHLIKELSKYNITTVSGLADGIDTVVHEMSIKHGLRTIAVLGNGICCYYPSRNRKLQEKISNYGVVISEFPCKYPPSKTTFPQRNRIIAGLSLGTLVVEADIQSGAMITTKFALELGKDVFAIPGSIFSRQSRGTNFLIKTGAKLITSAEDIIEELEPITKYIREKSSKPSIKSEEPTILKLSEKHKLVLDIINSEPDGVHIDKLQSLSGIELTQLLGILFDLELDGLIKSLPGKIYISIEK